MEKAEHSQVHVLVLRPQFVDVISQIVGFRAPQLMSELSETLQANAALLSSLLSELVEPLQERHGAVVLLIGDQIDSRHSDLQNVSKIVNKVEP